MRPGHFDLIKMDNEARKRVTIYEPDTPAELHVFHEERADGRPCCMSVWYPSEEEIEALKKGLPIQLRIIAEKQPFVNVSIYTGK